MRRFSLQCGIHPINRRWKVDVDGSAEEQAVFEIPCSLITAAREFVGSVCCLWRVLLSVIHMHMHMFTRLAVHVGLCWKSHFVTECMKFYRSKCVQLTADELVIRTRTSNTVRMWITWILFCLRLHVIRAELSSEICLQMIDYFCRIANFWSKREMHSKYDGANVVFKLSRFDSWC